MQKVRKPRKAADRAPGLGHAEVFDFVTGGAAAWANRQHAHPAKKTSRAAAAPSVRMSVNMRADLNSRLKRVAAKRNVHVRDLLEELVLRHLKD